MKISDEMLMAYADGELDLVARAEVEAAIAANPELARAVERHRALAGRVRDAYQGVLEEPVPPQLSTITDAPVAAPVVDLAAIRAERATANATVTVSRWQLPQWSAMAAAMALGLFVGVFALRGPGEPWEETATGLVARGVLDQALTTQLAGSVGTGEPASAGSGVHINVSFRDHSGAYCRSFQLQHTAPLAGLACREQDEWRLRVLAPATAGGGDLRTASALPIAVLQAMDSAIEGEPLDAAGEAAAREAGWR